MLLPLLIYVLPAVAAAVGFTLWPRYATPRHQVWPDRELAWALWHWFAGGKATWQWPPLETDKSDLPANLPRRLAVACLRVAATASAVGLWVGNRDPLAVAALTVWLVIVAMLVMVGTIQRAMHRWWVVPLTHALWETSGWAAVYKSDSIAGWAQRRRGHAFVKTRRFGIRWDAERKWFWFDTRLFLKIELPLSFDNSELNRKKFMQQAVAVCDLGEMTPQWHTTGHFSSVRLYPELRLPPPPKWADKHVREVMRPKLGPMIWPHGIGRGGVAVVRSRKTDNPHLAISAGTIGGKSTALRWYAANVLHFGGLVVICDIKRHSHIWARDLPGTLIFPDVTLGDDAPPAGEQINEALLHVWAEIERRNRECDPLRVGDLWPEFQPVLLVFDELNTTMTAMNRWWKTARPNTRAGDLAPGTHALQDILHQGRAVCVSTAYGAQAARRRAFGGGEGFEDIGNFLMVPPYSKATWNVVAPHIEFIPARSHHSDPAWAVLLDGNDAVEIQRIEMTDLEAVRFSAAGNQRRAEWCDSPQIAGLRAIGTAQPDRTEWAPHPNAIGTAERPILEDPGTSGDADDFDVCTLREASKDKGDGVVPMRYDALRKAAELRGFPNPAIDHPMKSRRKFLRQDLVDWFEYRSGLGDPGVYVLWEPGDRKAKIGETKDLEQRIDSLSLHPKVVYAWVACASKQDGQVLEEELHTRFGRWRDEDNREWFLAEDDVAEWMAHLAVVQFLARSNPRYLIEKLEVAA